MGIVSQPKKLILFELRDSPKHGYLIAKNTDLPMGSIYDHLAELVEEGYIEYTEEGRRKVYNLTKKGELLLEALNN
ncbi:MAG: PadR family transcriptional regulator [Thermoplasmatota archaeon]